MTPEQNRKVREIEDEHPEVGLGWTLNVSRAIDVSGNEHLVVWLEGGGEHWVIDERGGLQC